MLAGPAMMSPNDDCNVALVGKGRVIDDLGGGTLCLLCNSPDLPNILDGDLTNYTEFDATVSILSATPIVSVRDIAQSWPAGRRVGYVVEPEGGLLDLSILESFQLRTYLGGVLQEIAVGGIDIDVELLSGDGRQQRISFVTTEPFDEVELVAEIGRAHV